MMEELEKAASKEEGRTSMDAADGGGDDGEKTNNKTVNKMDADSSSSGSDLTTNALSTSSSFYTWWRDQEAAVLREKEIKYMLHGSRLKKALDQCISLRDAIDSVMEHLDQLRLLHRSVGAKSQSLTGACDKLIAEERKLEAFADALRGKLEYFDELERLAPQCNNNAINAQLQRMTKFVGLVPAVCPFLDHTVKCFA